MRNLLAFLAALAITIGVVGWYLDWFHIQTCTSRQSGDRNVEIDINTKKIGDDLHKGEQKIQDALDKGKKEETETGKKVPDGARDDASRAADSVKEEATRRFDNVRDETIKR